MARVPVVTRDMVAPEFQEAYDQVIKEAGGPITGGPGPNATAWSDPLPGEIHTDGQLPALTRPR